MLYHCFIAPMTTVDRESPLPVTPASGDDKIPVAVERSKILIDDQDFGALAHGVLLAYTCPSWPRKSCNFANSKSSSMGLLK